MLTPPGIGLRNQCPVEALLASARFVARDQQDRLTRRIECKGHPPHPAVRIESQLLHVGVLGSFQRIDPRPARLWTKSLDHLRLRQQFDLDCGCERWKLRSKFGRKADCPSHGELCS